MVSITASITRRSLLRYKKLIALSRQNYATVEHSTNLKEVLSRKIPEHDKRVSEFRKEHGKTAVQNVTIDMIYGGMRNMIGLVTETSVLDPEEGIRFRGYSIPECQKLLPKAEDGEEPIPEAIWWLLLTGEIPTGRQVDTVTKELNQRADLPDHVVKLLDGLPSNLHPMSQFVAAIAALQSESQFAAAYARREYAYEDAMNLLAKLPTLAAIIYRNLYRNGSSIGPIDVKKDWSGNFAAMLGYDDPQFVELLRLYLVIHSDHEGGNVSAHTCHLVGSTLADPYLSFSGAMAGLAGPLHGLANQEVLVFLNKIIDELGTSIPKEKLRDWLRNHLKNGQIIPGYGHAILRKTDPRYTCQREFALKHLSDENMFQLVSDLYSIAPKILIEQGKVKNPWPNIDAHSGILLQHYGLKEMNYYTVLFGVSRALGCMAQLIWARAMGLPIEHPRSHSTEELMELARITNVKAS